MYVDVSVTKKVCKTNFIIFRYLSYFYDLHAVALTFDLIEERASASLRTIFNSQTRNFNSHFASCVILINHVCICKPAVCDLSYILQFTALSPKFLSYVLNVPTSVSRRPRHAKSRLSFRKLILVVYGGGILDNWN